MDRLNAESTANSPYLGLRVGRIAAIFADTGDIPDESSVAATYALGKAHIEWLDWEGGRQFVPITFPAFSNPVSPSGIGKAYGDLSLPSVGDVVVVAFRSPSSPVILGYLPANYALQTNTDSGKSDTFGTFRRVQPGELSRKSKQQAEIYMDKAGGVQVIVFAQPTEASTQTEDGSDTANVTDIDEDSVPTEEIARLTIGECYTDEDFDNRAVNALGKKLIARLKTPTGVSINVDVEGNIEVNAATGKSTVINAGTKGAARLDDQTLSNTGVDSSFWSWMDQLKSAFNSWTPVSGDGGAALKSLLATPIASWPTSMTGKINQSSSTVKIGD